ncbi:MAG: helicase-exonuclease AddAB subunit AddB [Brotaphodocola sp.]
MSLQLILGGSGSGKTTFLHDSVIRSSIKHPEQLYFLIVPEQFTMQTQKDIVTRHPNHGTMNIDIVSFQRLAYRVFEELAVESLQVLDDMGKSMVLRKVAANQRKKLRLFSGHLNKNGFVGQLKSMLSEFYQYGITPQMLKALTADARTPLMKQKLEDFIVIFEGFQEYIAGHYITTEEVLDVLCRLIPESEIVKSSVIALDGYTGFTPVQYRLIELFMVHAKQVIVTVTADQTMPLYEKTGMQKLFYMSHQMVTRLDQLAQERHVKKLKDVWMPSPSVRLHESAELAWLEQNLFRYRGNTYHGTMSGSLELYQANNPTDEVAGVVHRIQQLIRDEGMKYREIAVVTGDLNGYGREVVHQFETNQIPFFLDDKKTLMNNPMVELIRAALDVVRKDFSYESVFQFLRTGLISSDREMLDRMENYALALGIRGHRRFGETWERVYRGGGNLNLQELNAFKDEVLAPLFALRESFHQEKLNVEGMVLAVKSMLADCQIQEKMELYQEHFERIGEHRLQKEYGQAYELVEELFKRLSNLLGSEVISVKEFSEILDAGFEEISVGVIPATVDRVVVGDITRTRLAHVKALFFIGVNDGIVPMRKEKGSLLTDQEREFFGEHKLELAPTAREDNFQQRFYLYLMMTKPSGKLILSYSGVGADGKSRRASYLIAELCRMFPQLACRENKAEIYSVSEGYETLIEGLRRYRKGDLSDAETDRFLELYRWFFASGEHQENVKQLVEAAFYIYEKQGLGHAVARALYGNILSGSVTRLEQYAACAYGHFLKYGLELMERKRYELAAADMGNLFHDSIDLCFRKVKEEGLDWRSITDEQRTELVHRCVEQVTSAYGNTILNSTARNAYLAKRVEKITQRTIWALQYQIKKGDFIPVGFEMAFTAADNLKALKISLTGDEELHLRGRIDRMDICQDGNQVYVKIIDYKSGSASFDLLALYYGLQLQLVVYLDAAIELTERRYPESEVLPAGILYYNIADPVIQKEGETDPEKIDAQILKELRMNGLINSELEAIRHLDHFIETESDIIPVVLKNDEVNQAKSSVANREMFDRLRTFVHEKLRCQGMEILDGEIAVEPYKSGGRTACDYCPYHAVCGFDKKTSGYEYRKLQNKKAGAIWEELCQENQ